MLFVHPVLWYTAARHAHVILTRAQGTRTPPHVVEGKLRLGPSRLGVWARRDGAALDLTRPEPRLRCSATYGLTAHPAMMFFAGAVLEDGAGSQQPDRRGGQEQRAVHTASVRRGRLGRVQRGRLQAPRVRAPQAVHARHTEAGPQVLHLFAVAHRRRLQGSVHVRTAVGVLHRLAGA